MRQNALDQRNFPLTTQAIMDSFYVDYSLDGADSFEEAIIVRDEMQELFELGEFVLWK